MVQPLPKIHALWHCYRTKELKEDLEIIRLQNKVRNSPDSTAWLEQLGWAFVGKARGSFDPGFYKLVLIA